MNPSGDDWSWVPTAPPDLAAFLAPDLQPVPVIPVVAVALAVCVEVGEGVSDGSAISVGSGRLARV